MKTTVFAGASAAAMSALARPVHPAILGSVRGEAGSDPAKVLADLHTGFEAFKAANDERLKQIEAKGAADPVTAEKVDKINAEIDRLNERFSALALNGSGGDRAETPDQQAYAAKFDAYFRTGSESIKAELKPLAIKAQLQRSSDPDGGYVVSPEIEKTIDRVLGTTSIMRQLATVRTSGAAVYKKLVGQGGTTSGWVGEGETRSQTNTPTLAELEFPAMTLYANPQATEEMLEDADFDIAAWLADEVNIEFAEEEGAAHITGNGVKKPRGLLGYDAVEDDSWTWGKLGFKISGDASTIASLDPLITLTEQLKQGYRGNAAFLANRKTLATIRKLKDSYGQYHWQPSVQMGQPATLLGYPVYADDNMPDAASGTFPLAFGDFRRGYLIVDRRGIRILRNPYKTEGFVNFYTTKRTGGGVQNFQAIKLLKVAAA